VLGDDLRGDGRHVARTAVVAGLGQAGDVAELGVLQAPGLRLAVHHLDELLERAAHASASATEASLPLCTIMPLSSSSTLGRMVVSMNISDPPPLRSLQARSDTGDLLLERELLVADGVEHQVGRHQLGQRRRVGLRVGVARGQHLVAGQVEQDVLARRDLGRLRQLGVRGQGQADQQGQGQRIRRSRSEGRKKKARGTGAEGVGASVPGSRRPVA
jgi:hypothetical protein